MDGQIGLEKTPKEYVDSLVAVFREVRRVLRNDGSLWIVIGDSYAGSWGAQGRQGITGQMANRSVADVRGRSKIQAARIIADIYPVKLTRTGSIPKTSCLKSKDLIGIPWMLAFALRDDGWYLREEIVWMKSSCMPESVQDRCTRQHETVFHLTKSERYFHDAFAIAESYANSSIDHMSQPTFDTQQGGDKDYGNGTNKNRSVRKTLENLKAKLFDKQGKQAGHGARHAGFNERWKTSKESNTAVGYRNARSVWTINPESFDSQMCLACGTYFRGVEYKRLPRDGHNHRICSFCAATDHWSSHFAVFPTRLVSRILRCSTPDGGCCGSCGTPLKRIVEKGEPDEAWKKASGADTSGGYAGVSRDGAIAGGAQDASATKARILAGMAAKKTTGWKRTCDCGDSASVQPSLVLDPFSGAGTSALCANRLGRHAIGIDLTRDYNVMAANRLRDENAKCLDTDGARLPFACVDLTEA